MTGAEAGVLVIMFLWAVVIVCFIVGSLADRRRRRALQTRLDREAAEAAARRRSQAPYQWPKNRPLPQAFTPDPAAYQPTMHNPITVSWDATPSPSCDSSPSVSVSCD